MVKNNRGGVQRESNLELYRILVMLSIVAHHYVRYIPLINCIASSTFGVLCIHANSDAMRRWLWIEVFGNVKYFDSPYLVLHALGTVLAVYAGCTFIDQLRILCIEKPFFRFYDVYIFPRLEKRMGE